MHNTNRTRNNLQEVTARNETARAIVEGFSTALPTLGRFWREIITSLNDIPVLAEEITQLRLDRANLAAATRATLAAYNDGEPDPLSYVRDELATQGFRGRS